MAVVAILSAAAIVQADQASPARASADANEGVNLFHVQIGGKYSYIDRTGKVVVKTPFKWADVFSEGLADITVNDKYGYIDTKGKIVIEPKWEVARPFSDGMAVVGTGQYGNHLYGYIDKTGKVIVQPKFTDADDFSEGLGRVKVGKLYGYVDKSGKLAIPPSFFSAGKFSEGVASVLRTQYLTSACYIDRQGKVVLEPKDIVVARPFSEGLAAVLVYVGSDQKWGFIGHSGNFVIPPTLPGYVYPRQFSDGLAFIKGGGLTHPSSQYIDHTGKVVISGDWDEAGDFRDGFAPIKVKGGCGAIDKSGRVVIPAKYDMPFRFTEGLAYVWQSVGQFGVRYEYIDTTGRPVWSNFRWVFGPLQFLGVAFAFSVVALLMHLIVALVVVVVLKLPKVRIRVAFIPFGLQLLALAGAWLWFGFNLPFSLSGAKWTAAGVFLVTDLIAAIVLVRPLALPRLKMALVAAVVGVCWAVVSLVLIPVVGMVAVIVFAKSLMSGMGL